MGKFELIRMGWLTLAQLRQQAEDDPRSALVRFQVFHRLVCLECATMSAESYSRFQPIDRKVQHPPSAEALTIRWTWESKMNPTCFGQSANEARDPRICKNKKTNELVFVE